MTICCVFVCNVGFIECVDTQNYHTRFNYPKMIPDLSFGQNSYGGGCNLNTTNDYEINQGFMAPEYSYTSFMPYDSFKGKLFLRI